MGHQSGAAEPRRDRIAVARRAEVYRALTAANVTLLFIDHQVGPLWELEFGGTRRAVAHLAGLARYCQIPAIVTVTSVESWGPVIPELTEILRDAVPIVRDLVDAWQDGATRRAVEATGRKKLLIAGGAGELGVTACALSAIDDGYEVYAAIDACGELGDGAIERLSRAGVIITATSVVAAEILSLSRQAQGC